MEHHHFPITAVISALAFIIVAIVIIGFILKDAMNRLKEK